MIETKVNARKAFVIADIIGEIRKAKSEMTEGKISGFCVPKKTMSKYEREGIAQNISRWSGKDVNIKPDGNNFVFEFAK